MKIYDFNVFDYSTKEHKKIDFDISEVFSVISVGESLYELALDKNRDGVLDKYLITYLSGMFIKGNMG